LEKKSSIGTNFKICSVGSNLTIGTKKYSTGTNCSIGTNGIKNVPSELPGGKKKKRVEKN
jgi:hypothetical protein